MKDGRILNLLAEGRLVNLAAGNGHPAEIMDMSFAVQALSALYILENHENLENKVINVTDEIDTKVAERKLAAWGTKIDKLTHKQQEYLNSWNL